MSKVYRTIHYWFLIFIIISAVSCSGGEEESDELTGTSTVQPVDRDLEKIKEDGVLRVITSYSMTSYFLYRGQPMGFEYELLQRLADHLDLELEIVVAHNLNQFLRMLNEGKGDLVAHGLAVTQARKKKVAFTDYHFLTHQVLVQKKPDNWRKMPRHRVQATLVNDAIELIGDTVHVRKNSSYYLRLQNLSNEIGGQIHAKPVSGDLATEDIIRKVREGEIKYTVADYNIAAINQTYFRDLHIDVPISLSQRIAWAVRPNADSLKSVINNWIGQMKKKADYYVIYNKYFKNRKSFRTRVNSELLSRKTGKISPYDSLIRMHSDKIGWDWRLVASQVYQESRFRNGRQSWAGAQGLLQLMPATARELGVRNVNDPNDNLRGGIKYLDQLYERWDQIPDSLERIKFTLASYNCGFGHVKDAVRLAEKHGADPKKWDGNVAEYVRKLSSRKYYTDPVVRYGYVRGSEPYAYVNDIFARYDHYARFVTRDAEPVTTS